MTQRRNGLVSVVIPTRDRAPLLGGAISAVLAQDHPRLQVIVVDDGSTDDTPRVIARAAAADGRVRSLRNEVSRGAAAARNAGAEAADGEYLLFEDDDCRGEPDRLRKLVRALERAPRAGYAYCRGRDTDTAGATTVKGGEGPLAVGTPAALVRAEVFHRVGGFDPALPRLQDFDLWVRILAHHPAVEVPEVLYRTVRDPSGISASTDALVEAARHLAGKFAGSDLPSGHEARMHRSLGGSLLLRGRREGLAHFRRAIRLAPLDPRGWLALLAGLAGARSYRAAVRFRRALGSDAVASAPLPAPSTEER